MSNRNKTNEIKTVKAKIKLQAFLDATYLYFTSVDINRLQFNMLKTPLICFDNSNKSILIVGFRGNQAIKWKDYSDSNHFEIESIEIDKCTIEVECVLLSTLKDNNVKFTKQLNFLND